MQDVALQCAALPERTLNEDGMVSFVDADDKV